MSPPRPADGLPTLRCTPLMPLLASWVALPGDKAHALVRRAEALHDTLEAGATYPLDFVAFKLTGFRRDHGDAALLIGEALAHDLRWVVDALTRRWPMDAAADDARTAAEWAQELGVDVRTLRRWRGVGLRWRWLVAAASASPRPKLGHTAKAVALFQSRHAQRVVDAQRLTRLSAAERRAALERAAGLAMQAPERSLSDIAQQIADELGRAHETIRQLLLRTAERADAPSPFPKAGGLLTPRQRRQTLRAYRGGVSLRELGRRVGKSGPTMHRWLLARRVAVLRRVALEHVPSPLFDRGDAAEVYLRSPPPPRPADALRQQPGLLQGFPEAVSALLRTTHRWDEADRRGMFLRMNFLKHRAAAQRDGLPADALLTAGVLDALERDIRAAAVLHAALIQGELLHLLSLVRRQAVAVTGPAGTPPPMLLLAGLHTLVRAIDSYAASGNLRFETYLRNRVQRALVPKVAALETSPGTGEHESPRLRAVRRDEPTSDARAWQAVLDQLRRWVPGPPLEVSGNTVAHDGPA